MGFADECSKADRRYRAGKDPVYIKPEHWDRARDVQRKLKRGSIPSTWAQPEWSLDRLYWHIQHVHEQARLRAGAKPGQDTTGA